MVPSYIMWSSWHGQVVMLKPRAFLNINRYILQCKGSVLSRTAVYTMCVLQLDYSPNINVNSLLKWRVSSRRRGLQCLFTYLQRLFTPLLICPKYMAQKSDQLQFCIEADDWTGGKDYCPLTVANVQGNAALSERSVSCAAQQVVSVTLSVSWMHISYSRHVPSQTHPLGCFRPGYRHWFPPIPL